MPLMLLFTCVTECCSPSLPWGGAATLLSPLSLTDLTPSSFLFLTAELIISQCAD